MSRKLKVIKKSHRRTYLDPLYKDSKLSGDVAVEWFLMQSLIQ